MMKIDRVITNICSKELEKSKDFYVKLLGLEVQFESDWYIQLAVLKNASLAFGIIKYDHEIVPKEFRKMPEGSFITFVVEDVTDVYEIAKQEGFDIVEPPKDLFYGQRRLLLRDPNGFLVDISSTIANFQE